MLKTSSTSKSVFIMVIASVIIGGGGYFAVQLERQFEMELEAIGVTTQATITGCSSFGGGSVELQFEVPMISEKQDDNQSLSKTYVAYDDMSVGRCNNNRGQQETIRYLPYDPTKIRIVDSVFGSNYIPPFIIFIIALLWVGTLVDFINSKKRKG